MPACTFISHQKGITGRWLSTILVRQKAGLLKADLEEARSKPRQSMQTNGMQTTWKYPHGKVKLWLSNWSGTASSREGFDKLMAHLLVDHKRHFEALKLHHVDVDYSGLLGTAKAVAAAW